MKATAVGDATLTRTTNQQNATLDSAATNTTHAANSSQKSTNSVTNAMQSNLSGDDNTNKRTSKRAPPVQANASSEGDSGNQSVVQQSPTAQTSGKRRRTNEKSKHEKTREEMPPSKVVQQPEEETNSASFQSSAQLSRRQPKRGRPPSTIYVMTAKTTEKEDASISEKRSSLPRRTASSSGETETTKTGSNVGTRKRPRKGDSYKSTPSVPEIQEATQPVRTKRKRRLEVLVENALSEVSTSRKKGFLGLVEKSFSSTAKAEAQKYMNDNLLALSNSEEAGVQPLNEAFERALADVAGEKNRWCAIVEKSCQATLEKEFEKRTTETLENDTTILKAISEDMPKQTQANDPPRDSSKKARFLARAEETDKAVVAQDAPRHRTPSSDLFRDKQTETYMPRISDASVVKGQGEKSEATPSERWQSQETTHSTAHASVSKASNKQQQKESQKVTRTQENAPESRGEARSFDKRKGGTKRRIKLKSAATPKRNGSVHVKSSVSEAPKDRAKERTTRKTLDKDSNNILHQIQASDRRAPPPPPQFEACTHGAPDKHVPKRDPQKLSTHPQQHARKSEQQLGARAAALLSGKETISSSLYARAQECH